MICTPDNLMREAKCFRCIPAGTLPEVISYLMCQWSNKSSAPVINVHWEPVTKLSSWTDSSGPGHVGDLAAFLANPLVASVTSLELDNQGITSITGLQSLPNLSFLNVSYNLLTTLDVSNCSKLVTLVFAYCGNLTSVNLSGCVNLDSITGDYCGQLTSLDASGCPKVTGITLHSDTALDPLNTTGCSFLVFVDIAYSGVVTWTGVGNLPALLDVFMAGAPMVSVNFANSTVIRSIQAPTCPNLTNVGIPLVNGMLNLDLSIVVTITPATMSTIICQCDFGGKLNGALHYSVVPTAPGANCLTNLGVKGWTITFV